MSLTVDEALHSLVFIRDVPGSVVQELAGIGSIQTFEAGERIFVEGELREQFAVVLDGNVMLEMNVPGRGDSSRFCHWGRGTFSAGRRSSTVAA